MGPDGTRSFAIEDWFVPVVIGPVLGLFALRWLVRR
jgi:hypothetical protein